MTAKAGELFTELTALSEAERAEVAHRLIASLDPGCDADADAAWDAELDRRLEEIRNGTEEGESAESVFARIRAKYS